MVPQISKDGKEGHAIMLCADSARSGEWKHPSIAIDVNLKLESGIRRLDISSLDFTVAVYIYWQCPADHLKKKNQHPHQRQIEVSYFDFIDAFVVCRFIVLLAMN